MSENDLGWREAMSDVTRILEAIENGDTRAVDKLLPAVYEDLRQLAAQKLSGESPGHTLQATALVHEAYLRLKADAPGNWSSRTHFFAAAAEAMRRILVENARRKHRLKRGGRLHRVELDEAIVSIDSPSPDIIALDQALTELSDVEPTVADLVKVRYFGGLTLEQAAELCGISRRTATRHWTFARAWLYRRIAKEPLFDEA